MMSMDGIEFIYTICHVHKIMHAMVVKLLDFKNKLP